jgi:hypothetical protein
MKHCTRNEYEDRLIDAIFRNEIMHLADPEGFLLRRSNNGRDCKKRLAIIFSILILTEMFGCAPKKPVQTAKPSPPMILVVH